MIRSPWLSHSLSNQEEKDMDVNLKEVVGVVTGAALLFSVGAQAGEDWQFTARMDIWLPDTSGETAFSGADFKMDVEDILDDVEFGFLGSFEARRGRWGIVTDIVYSSIGDKNDNFYEGSVGPGEGLALEGNLSVDLDVDTWFVNSAAFYRAVESESLILDVLAGVRYADVEQRIEWEISGNLGGSELPGRSGWAEVGEEILDGIVGVRGRVGLGESDRWVLPFYLDVGTGGSDFTWQAAAGLGYGFDWGNMGLVWRHLEYDLESDAAIADLQLSGPAAVFEFSW